MVNYRASRDGSGALVVHGVPVFCECERGDFVADAAWVEAAVQNAQRAEREGYFPPLHIRHHERGDEVRPAGYFRVTGSSRITLKGKTRLAVIADLVVTDPTVQTEVLSRRLPYRSVEILDVTRPAIDSLALLDHETPYLELPMLFVADDDSAAVACSARVANPWASGERMTAGEPVACFRRGRAAVLLPEDSEDPMADPKNPKKRALFMESGGESDSSSDSGEGGDASALDVAAIVAAIGDGSISVADMEAIVAAVNARMGAAAEPEEPEEAPMPNVAPAAVPGAESMAAKPATSSVALAAAQGEIVALRARLDERDAADKRRDDVTAALKRLEGRPLGSDLEAKLVAFHKTHGAEAFAAHVDAMASTFAAVAGADTGAAARFAGHGGAAPKTALRFQGLGPDAVAKATTLAREHAELLKHRCTSVPLDRYVEIHMSRAGFELASRN